MLRMGQGLKLASALRRPFPEACLPVPRPLGDLCQKLHLRHEGFRFQTGGFSGGTECGEIHMGGKILFARIREQVGV